ncbi:pyridoxal 5'-phosphate synthase [Streptomyces olivaceus]|uniref:pyridoxine/pyridoxamine 5'-phosphate oxidase n=2 Tax=Streptomyces olivaceus TaxID=47716 RepID=UPI001CCD20CA|nr:pyridoxal 5'-phosphate synthase [Streptomyces olivaceus]MBZ6083303.1 pyridoxal 5'-phosphate synthase [Streptomyces olivaceus]
MRSVDELLRSLRVWDPAVTELPPFDPADAPGDPLALFTRWFGEAVAAGQSEPHTVSLATAGPEGLPDVRVVMLHGADADGWSFATHADSRKGRHLAARPYAALLFYWPVLGRQVRVRGPVAVAPAEEAQADLHARSAGALAAALTGRQSAELGSVAELARASEAAWERAGREPDAPAPTWALYRLRPEEVEFFQGDARRRHVRLTYRRAPGGEATEDQGAEGEGDGGGGGGGWEQRLLWP